jgi:phosphoribosyl-ATP pyrophosphohydrolase/phosphoribosyl-AMP cyclohydrolase/histidinol dehydrogenase
MALPFLISIDAKSLASAQPAGSLSVKQISYLGRVLLKSPTPAQASAFLSDNFAQLDIHIDATGFKSTTDVVDILNAGATCVFVTPAQLHALSAEQSVPSSRLVASLSSPADIAALKNWVAESPEHREISAHSLAEAEFASLTADLGHDSVAKTVYRSYDSLPRKTALLVDAQERVISILPSTSLSVDDEEKSPAKLILSPVTADSTTNLYPTVVTDERGVSLGFVFSSEESVREALKTGTGVYQSRKRGLWYKGASSGDVQELVRVGVDCDSDCLVFVVRQKGKGTLCSLNLL